MANLYGLDATGNSAYVRATGAGSNADPYIVNNDLFSSEIKSAAISNNASADVVAAVSSKKIRVLSLALTASAACTVKLQTGASTDLTPPFHLAANGPMTISNPLGLFETAVSAKLNAVLSGTATYTVFVTYREVS